MRAKPLLYAVVAATLLLGAASAMGADSTTSTSIYTAAPASNQPLNSNVLPVIVRVSKQGKITYLAPAYELRSQYQRLLRQSLAQMITQPAHDKSGAPIASEFIMYLTGTTTKREDGKYDFRFTYLSAKPIPFGNWIWGQFASGQLALLSPDYDRDAFPRQRSFKQGQCYYDNRLYKSCAVFTCVQYKTCDENKSDGDKGDKNGKGDNKSKATGTAIRAASAGIYRLHRPSIVNRTPRTPMRGRRAQHFYGPNVVPLGRVGPLPAPTNDGMRGVRAASVRAQSANSGTGRRAPPEPVSRGAIP